MNPKEKAKEIVEKYIDIDLPRTMKAKKCALIVVEEIINLPLGTKYVGYEYAPNINKVITQIEYWNEVKQEIEKL